MKLIRQVIALLFLIILLGSAAWALLSFGGLEKIPYLERFSNQITSGIAKYNLPVDIPGKSRLESLRPPVKTPVLTLAMVADAHTDFANLQKALAQAKQMGSSVVIGLGDYTQVGTSEELTQARQVFSANDLPYYIFWGLVSNGFKRAFEKQLPSSS